MNNNKDNNIVLSTLIADALSLGSHWTPFFPGPLVTRTREGRKQILSSNEPAA